MMMVVIFRFIMAELLQTERTYVKDLETCIRVWYYINILFVNCITCEPYHYYLASLILLVFLLSATCCCCWVVFMLCVVFVCSVTWMKWWPAAASCRQELPAVRTSYLATLSRFTSFTRSLLIDWHLYFLVDSFTFENIAWYKLTVKCLS